MTVLTLDAAIWATDTGTRLACMRILGMLGGVFVAHTSEKVHLSEEVAQEECQKRNHQDVDQCVGAIQEGLLLSAHAAIALQHYIHAIDF